MATLENLSIDELEAALAEKRNQQKDELETQRLELLQQVKEIEGKIAEITGNKYPNGRGGPRHSNSMSLKEAITNVLRGSKKGFTKDEIADAVQTLGYKSTSDKFAGIVYQTLYKHDEFVRGDDRRYTLKTAKK